MSVQRGAGTPRNLPVWRPALLAVGEAFGEAGGKAGLKNLLLGFGNVVIEPAQLDRSFIQIINDVGGFRVVVARLTDAADVHEIFPAGLHLELRIGAATNMTIANERHRHMR